MPWKSLTWWIKGCVLIHLWLIMEMTTVPMHPISQWVGLTRVAPCVRTWLWFWFVKRVCVHFSVLCVHSFSHGSTQSFFWPQLSVLCFLSSCSVPQRLSWKLCCCSYSIAVYELHLHFQSDFLPALCIVIRSEQVTHSLTLKSCNNTVKQQQLVAERNITFSSWTPCATVMDTHDDTDSRCYTCYCL